MDRVTKETTERVERETRKAMTRSMVAVGVSEAQDAVSASISVEEVRSIVNAAP